MAKRSKRDAVAAPDAAALSRAPPPASGEAEDFAIVGIGASAGGLEALEQFLSRVPADCGMAFIVIQHLDPTRKGIMPELLQRVTDMTVVQADNQMKVAPHCVYVIPPNKDMSILHGSLHLLDPVAARGLRLPIDFFFRALADDRHERAVCVVLSGMGSDGTLGLKAVKEKGGLVLVQDPASAKFGGMPRSAIDTGLADIVAPAEALPARLVAAYRHPLSAQAHERLPEGPSESALDKITLLLRARTGRDFSPYKKSTIVRRIERRMGIHQIDKIAVYVRYLQENPGEVDLLFRELLIGVTSFFRDPAAWAHLREHALPQRLAQLPNGGTVRAWVPACSTGEEAYSLAIVLHELQQQAAPANRFDFQVFATDLDQDAIDKARQGFYPSNIAADVTPERLEHYFVTEEGGYRVSKEIRERVIFAPQDVLSDPPFTKLDVLSCRNLLIYLSAQAQTKLLPLFHYSLSPGGGILFLGSAETIGNFTDLFAPLDGKARIYRRIGSSAATAAAALPAQPLADRRRTFAADAVHPAGGSLQALADRLILQRFAPAAVLVNSQGDVLYISGRTGNYLEPAAGKANWNIHAMARDGLRHELGMALSKALRQRGTVEADGLAVEVNGSRHNVKLSVHAIDEPLELHGMALIAFEDVAAAPRAADSTGHAPARGARAAGLEAELNRARQENLTVREEMQTSQEELRSANEELQSTNEELQSTNEELTTSKEELQSLNEELQTVNAELQSKVDELSRTNNDMKNLLNSTDIATVFLDGMLKVRRFTSPATRLIKLIPGDVGRPLSDSVTDLDYHDLQADAQQVLRTLVYSQKEVPTHDGRWYSIRIMPYRTLDNIIDGVVITFVDISAAKVLEARLRRIKDGDSPAAGDGA